MAQSDGTPPEESEESAENPGGEGASRYRVAAGASFPLTSVRWVAPYGAREGVGVLWIALALFVLALAVLTIENPGTAALVLGGVLLLALIAGPPGRHRHRRRHHRHHHRCGHRRERWPCPEREETAA